jgi:hypothetical protein
MRAKHAVAGWLKKALHMRVKPASTIIGSASTALGVAELIDEPDPAYTNPPDLIVNS